MESFRRWKESFGKREKLPEISYKKYKPEKLYDLVVECLKQDIGYHPTVTWKDQVYAEPIARHLRVKDHEVRQVFHKLNLEGKMSQAIKWNLHECLGYMHTRYDRDDVIQWEAKWYEVYKDKL